MSRGRTVGVAIVVGAMWGGIMGVLMQAFDSEPIKLTVGFLWILVGVVLHPPLSLLSNWLTRRYLIRFRDGS